MPNKIAENQNTNLVIDRLAAQRELYSRAKLIFNTRVFFALMLALIGPLVISTFNDTEPYVAFISIVYILIDIFSLERKENECRESAAKIQELIDTELFSLDWNSIVVGNKPDTELIYKNSKAFKKKNTTSTLIDWYPKNISPLDIIPAILICQRSSIWWDVNLRKVYVSILYSLLLFFSAFALILAVVQNLEIKGILSIALPLLPIYRIFINQIMAQRLTIERTNELKIHTESLIDQITEGNFEENSLITGIRKIQDELYRHRKSCFSLPDWLYKTLRESQEEQMVYNADVHIEKFLRPLETK